METIEMEENTHGNSIKKEGSEQNSGNYVYGKSERTTECSFFFLFVLQFIHCCGSFFATFLNTKCIFFSLLKNASFFETFILVFQICCEI